MKYTDVLILQYGLLRVSYKIFVTDGSFDVLVYFLGKYLCQLYGILNSLQVDNNSSTNRFINQFREHYI